MRKIPAAMITASRRGQVPPRSGTTAAAMASVLLALAAAAPACKLDQKGVSPPLDRIVFPASALVDPGGEWLYVANSNSDLRYNNGTLVAVDLVNAMRDRFPPDGYTPVWPVCAGADHVREDSDEAACCWDFLDHQILDCDERLYIPPASTVEIGSFSAGMTFQSSQAACAATNPNPTPATRHECSCPTDGAANGRLFIGVRGNSSLTYAETSMVFDPTLNLHNDYATDEDRRNAPGRNRPVFSCAHPSSEGDEVCKVQSTMPESPGASDAITVPDEPYALVLDEQQDLLYVGNLRGDTSHPQTGGISLFDVSRTGSHDVPRFLGPTSAFFNPDGNGQFGVTSLTLFSNKVYVTSRYGTNAVDVIPSFAPGQMCKVDLSLTKGDVTLSTGGDVFTTPLSGAEIRGIKFLPDANRAFVLQRVPPALVGFDTSKDPLAFGNFPSDVLETCAGPTFLQAYDTQEGEGTRLYVTCFDAGQVYVFDPYVPRLIQVINAGRGPAGLAFPSKPAAHPVAYVVGFSANDIGVIDLMAGSPTQYHVVQRIGFPSAVPR
jgi:DNA-binding beta-propeller fold protein YncE